MSGGFASKDMLHAAIEDADIRILLMVLFHMTGDRRWLRAPFTPHRDVRLIPDPQAGLSQEVQREVREAAKSLFADGIPPVVVSRPDTATLQQMMSCCLGETVAPEYAALGLEEMGFTDRNVRWKNKPDAGALAAHHVLIVGAGVSGISLGASLGRLGIPYTIVEKNPGLGGTWYVNRYPGCGVDTPNHSYSFSFGDRYKWSRYFSPREEVLDYLQGIATTAGVECNIRFNTRLVSACWNAESRRWEAVLETEGGRETISTSILVSAIGQLNDPVMPPIKGADAFAGPLFHSANWSRDTKIAGKRVAIIGTGATAMQLVPTICDQAQSVTIFQRSPQWARPIEGFSDPINPGTQWLLEHLPFYAQWFRFNMFWRYGDGLLPLLKKDPNWEYPDRSINRANERHREELTNFIRQELGDRADLLEKCIPTYPPYGKRILLDNGWYRTLLRPNVELVSDSIDHIAAHGIVTTDGTAREFDMVVYATGFRVSEMAARLNISGIGGQTLATVWADDNPTAYLGLTVPGFPNFFCMLGPNSGPAHGGSVIFQAECQTRYITDCLVQMVQRGFDAIDVRQDVHDAHVAAVDREHEQLVWTHKGMSTYYRNKKGRVFSVMPWRFVDYWQMTHDADLSEYHCDPCSSPPIMPRLESETVAGSV